jgi:hypothetical protein
VNNALYPKRKSNAYIIYTVKFMYRGREREKERGELELISDYSGMEI